MIVFLWGIISYICEYFWPLKRFDFVEHKIELNIWDKCSQIFGPIPKVHGHPSLIQEMKCVVAEILIHNCGPLKLFSLTRCKTKTSRDLPLTSIYTFGMNLNVLILFWLESLSRRMETIYDTNADFIMMLIKLLVRSFRSHIYSSYLHHFIRLFEMLWFETVYSYFTLCITIIYVAITIHFTERLMIKICEILQMKTIQVRRIQIKVFK